MKKHVAISIADTGEELRFQPTFEKGDRETQAFAHEAKQDMETGGVSISISSKASNEAIAKAIACLSEFIR